MADDTVIKNVAARIDDIPRFSRVIFIYFNEPIIVMKFIESTRREIVRVCHSRHPLPPLLPSGPPPSPGAKAGGITSVAETIRYAAYLACIIVTAIARARFDASYASQLRLSLQRWGHFQKKGGWPPRLEHSTVVHHSLSPSLSPSFIR